MKEMTSRILLGVIAVPALTAVLLFPLPFNIVLNLILFLFALMLLASV